MLLRVIDTGGLETARSTEKSSLLQSMQEQVWRAVAEAQAILFVIDAQEGVRPLGVAEPCAAPDHACGPAHRAAAARGGPCGPVSGALQDRDTEGGAVRP